MHWKYWDALALVAGAVPPGLAVVASAFDIHHGGAVIFLGSAGGLFRMLALTFVALFLIAGFMGWRSGNRGLILLGGLLLALSAAPSLLLLAACVSGHCI
ncbi:hypothetical protein [Sphingopyxis panaciterrae]